MYSIPGILIGIGVTVALIISIIIASTVTVCWHVRYAAVLIRMYMMLLIAQLNTTDNCYKSVKSVMFFVF